MEFFRRGIRNDCAMRRDVVDARRTVERAVQRVNDFDHEAIIASAEACEIE